MTILTVVGVGPGDPELLTIKAVNAIKDADVVAYHSARPGSSIARRIAEPYLLPGVHEEEFLYPVTAGDSVGYYARLAEFYDDCGARVEKHFAAGRSVVLLAEGDPLFYGSAMYLADRFPTRVVPGVTGLSAATAAMGTGLCRHEDVLTVLPGTLPVPELARRIADTEAAVIMKLGRTFTNVVEALRQAGRLDDAVYVERASHVEERVLPLAEVDAATVPYMSLIVVPGIDVRADAAGRALDAQPKRPEQKTGSAAELLVVGLGPGPSEWLTPEAEQALAGVAHVVGYAPYVNRVPQREGLTRHSSGNTVEVDRAKFALGLALQGQRVAVVSGGDAGVFGMASAVFEAAQEEKYADVPIRVLPGLTAAQVVAAAAGAPLGGDFAVVNLSDRLKPWSVLEQRLRLLAAADVAICLYNPASRTRTEQIFRAKETLLDVRSPETVVVVGRDVGRSEHSISVTTLGDLRPDKIDMKCLVMVCPSSTKVTRGGQVWTPRFTLSD